MSVDRSAVPRFACASLALTASLSLALQFRADWLEMGAAASTGAVVWSMARYFTVLTNVIVAVLFARAALQNRWPAPGWLAAATVWIVAVGVVYHALLSASHNPQGFEVWSNIGFHTVVPAMTLALWIWAAPKPGLTFVAPVVWTIYPLTYAAYAILRGMSDGVYPYFFLDPVKSGLAVVLAYVLGLGVFFILAGCALVAIARTTHRRVTTGPIA